MQRAKKTSDSLLRELAREAAKYVLTGLIGASAVLAYTCYRRSPGRSLTISPGGARIVIGSSITCAERQFIAETLNAHLTDEIAVPPCNEVLDQDRRQSLKEELGAAQITWHSQRTVHFMETSKQLHAMTRHEGMPDIQLRGRIIGAIGSFRYIATEVPPGLEGDDLLEWAIARVDGQLSEFVEIERRIKALIDALDEQGSKRMSYQLDVFFLVTNTSDVEYYVPTRAILKIERRNIVHNVPVQLEQYGETNLPIRSLRFVPVQPGMGQLLRFRCSLTVNSAKDLLAAVKARESLPASLRADLPTGVVTSSRFDLGQFMQ